MMKILILLFVVLGLALMPSLLMAQQSGAAPGSLMVAQQQKEMHGKMHRGMESDTGAPAMEKAWRSGISDPGCPNLDQNVPIGSNYYDHDMGLPLALRP